MAAGMLQDFDSCSKRNELVAAIADRAKVSVSYILDPAIYNRAVAYSRIRGGHLEIYTASGWKRSTDLLKSA